MERVKCNQCDGNYTVRSSKFGTFAGCSNYPRCKSTLKLEEYIKYILQKNGINIYGWYRECFKCHKATRVYSYYLCYDLQEIDDYFSFFGGVGLGDIPTLDKFLENKYPTIKTKYSNTTKDSYVANTCQHCGCLQGRNYVVDDPHEIMEELYYDHSMNRYLVENIPFEKVNIPLNEIKDVFDMC